MQTAIISGLVEDCGIGVGTTLAIVPCGIGCPILTRGQVIPDGAISKVYPMNTRCVPGRGISYHYVCYNAAQSHSNNINENLYVKGYTVAINLPRLEADIAEQHQKRPFSGVIFIRENNEPLLAKGFGFANKAEAIANTLDTRFGIASGAKIFTAVAIGQLVEKGLVAFDSLFKDCVNISFPEFDPTITIHQLLTHSSGVPDYFDEEVMDDYEALWKERPMYGFRTPHDFVPLIQNHPMKFAPGTRWSYNNAGFILLGLVVEHLSGQSFTAYVEEHIFAVAGMNDTGYFAMDRLPARTAYGYIRDGVDGWRTNIYAVPVIGGPDGGVFTTALDMGKFWDSLLDNRLMNRTTTAQMLFPHLAAETQGANIYYGYGVYMMKQDENIVAFSVEGGDPGVVFYSVIYPEKKILLTILGNTTGVGWLTQHVVEPVRNA